MPGPLRVAYTLEQCWHDVPGGTAIAALEVAGRLADRSDIELVGVAGRHRRVPGPPFAPPVPVRSLPIARPWLYETWNRWEWPRVESTTGPVDVCHSTVAIPAATRLPHAVTVHDVAFVHAPERFSAHGARVMQVGLERCRRVDLVMCPSRSTADHLEELGFDHERLRIVPWGVTTHRVTDHDRRRVVSAYALPERFVLFVGTLEPRKNLARLAEAVARLDEPLPLVVAGAAGWGVDQPEPKVMSLGFVAAADLPVLYDLATVFAYPSLEEGYGMPILEAMAHGTPVVTSRGSATEEVAGGAATLVDPTDVDSIAGGIVAALGDGDRLSAAGRVRAAERSWETTVEATIAVYRELAR